MAGIAFVSGQEYAVYHNNSGHFNIFDNGKVIQAEYLPVKSYSVGGDCILYNDSRNNLKMYYNGNVSTVGYNVTGRVEANDYLAAFSIGSTIKIIEKGHVTTVSTNSVAYEARDSVVAFYDRNRQLLAVYYKGDIRILEDGLVRKPAIDFVTGDNMVAYVSPQTSDLKIFFQGQTVIIEPFMLGGSFTAGNDIVAFVNDADFQFKIFYRGDVYRVEDFEPESWQAGDGLVAYVDNMGSFKVFLNGEQFTISSFEPDFYRVEKQMVIFGEQGYFKVWYNNRVYTLEHYIPSEWKADWNTLVYVDQNRNVKTFNQGVTGVLTYDIVEDVELFRDVIVVNNGMNNHTVYYQGRKY